MSPTLAKTPSDFNKRSVLVGGVSRHVKLLNGNLVICLASFLCLFAAARAPGQTVPAPVPETTAKVQEVTKDVTIQKPDKPQADKARKGDKVLGKDVLKTGVLGSTADLEFEQNRARYRLESGSVFSFDPEDGKLYLTRGLALMSIENGKLVCESCKLLCTASSTAIMEVFTEDSKHSKHRGCVTKFILLEGRGTVTTLDGKQRRNLAGGEMVLQFEDESVLGEVQQIDLKRLVHESHIVTGFKIPLESMGRIQQVIDHQQQELWQGTLVPTRFTIAGRGSERYTEPASVKIGQEAPYDPDVPGGIKMVTLHCPICP